MTEPRQPEWHLNGDTYEVIPVHGQMQWRRADGSFAEYSGPLDDLGYGIPRNPETGWGIRRALFDLAFGYVSGFPILDVIAFSARSLFPPRRRA
jgi:hypothetical protein